MHVLIIFDHLPISGKTSRKEGVYPVFIKIHQENNIVTSVAVVRIDDIQAHKQMCEHYGARYIPPSSISINSIAKYIITCFNNTVRKFDLYSLIHWFYFILRNNRTLKGIDQYIEKYGKPDVISGLTSIEKSGRMAFLVGKRYNIHYTARENRGDYTRGLVYGHTRKYRQDVTHSASAVFPVSPTLGENMKRVLNQDIPHMIPLQNPVADFFFQKPNRRAAWINEFAKERFVFAGWTNWREIKRIDIALKAFASVHRENPETCLILAGPVPEWTETMIDDLQIPEAVFLTGSLGRKEIYDLAHGCHCCIVPSDHDTGNNSVLEALAAGKPVVVTVCGGSESRITEKKLGRIVPKDNVKEFSRAMKEIMKNYASFDSDYISSQAGRLYSEAAFAKTLITAYRKITFSSLPKNQ